MKNLENGPKLPYVAPETEGCADTQILLLNHGSDQGRI